MQKSYPCWSISLTPERVGIKSATELNGGSMNWSILEGMGERAEKVRKDQGWISFLKLA
jgi:hypothetical protein